MALKDEYKQESWKAGDFLKASQLNQISKTLDDTENAIIELQDKVGVLENGATETDSKIAETEERVNASIAELTASVGEKATVEQLNEVAGQLADKQDRGDYPVYKKFVGGSTDQERKTIQLDNFDSISGVDTNGTGHNLVMLSKWDVADFGATGVHLNLNTKDTVTINDDKVVATVNDVETKIQEEATRTDNLIVATKEAIESKVEADIADNIAPLATKEEVSAVEAKIPSIDVTAIDSAVALIPTLATKEALATVEGKIPENIVTYTPFQETRKTIQLSNHDSISGIGTNCLEGTENGYADGENLTGQGFNLAMVSKWNVADFGSNKIKLNLNAKNGVVTINDNKEVATTDLIDKVNGLIDVLSARLNVVEDLSYKTNNVETVGSIDDNSEVAGKVVVLNKQDNTPITGTKTFGIVLSEDNQMDVTKAPKQLFVVNENVESGNVSLAGSEQVSINVLKTEGELAKSVSNAGVKVNSNGEVTISNVDYSQLGYNGIEVGLNSVPSKVVLKNIDFNKKINNNAISVFEITDGGEILVENCKFVETSNPIRISIGNKKLSGDALTNATAKTATITIRDCEFGTWDSGEYAGMICLQDYSKFRQQFSKLTIKIENCTHNGEKIVGTTETLVDPSNQVVYLYNSTDGIVKYNEHADWFPTITAE